MESRRGLHWYRNTQNRMLGKYMYAKPDIFLNIPFHRNTQSEKNFNTITIIINHSNNIPKQKPWRVSLPLRCSDGGLPISMHTRITPPNIWGWVSSVRGSPSTQIYMCTLPDEEHKHANTHHTKHTQTKPAETGVTHPSPLLCLIRRVSPPPMYLNAPSPARSLTTGAAAVQSSAAGTPRRSAPPAPSQWPVASASTAAAAQHRAAGGRGAGDVPGVMDGLEGEGGGAGGPVQSCGSTKWGGGASPWYGVGGDRHKNFPK